MPVTRDEPDTFRRLGETEEFRACADGVERAAQAIDTADATVRRITEGRTMTTQQALVAQDGPQLPATMPITPMAMLATAIEKGMSTDVLEKLMALQERWEGNQARKAFDNAMAEARAELPVIFKNREVDFTSAKGRTNYRHEDMAGIARTVDPILAKHGLSYRFRTTSNLNEPVSVTCIVSHRLGHFEENTLCAGRDESGNKNSIQAVGSAITYLQRYTLKAALGLSASDDDDGRAAGNGPLVTDEQADKITALVNETKSDITLFLKWAGAESISDIKAAKFDAAVKMLEAKKRKAAPKAEQAS